MDESEEGEIVGITLDDLAAVLGVSKARAQSIATRRGFGLVTAGAAQGKDRRPGRPRVLYNARDVERELLREEQEARARELTAEERRRRLRQLLGG